MKKVLFWSPSLTGMGILLDENLKNGHCEVPRTGKFMKIDITHPQYTWILPVKWRLDIPSRLGDVRQQRICFGPPGPRAGPIICRNKLTKVCSDQVSNCQENFGPFYRVSLLRSRQKYNKDYIRLCIGYSFWFKYMLKNDVT